MGQREARLSKKIQQALRQKGYFCFKVWGNEMMMSGLPDILVCARGIFVGLETKLPESRHNLSRIQSFRHAQIRKAGGDVYVVCSVHEATLAVEDALSKWHFAGDPIEDPDPGYGPHS